MPFVYLWKIIKEVLEVQPDFSKATGIVHNGWMAVLFAVLSWLVYIAALVCSHGGAFRTASNMKKALMEHIARLPVGFADEIGSGRVRRTASCAQPAGYGFGGYAACQYGGYAFPL